MKNKSIVFLMLLLVIAAGLYSLREIPINSLPDVTPIQVLVITKAGTYAPNDVENLVSFPIENSMNGLPGVAEIRSISQFGLSVVTVEFEEGVDTYFARQVVTERLQTVAGDLPVGVEQPTLGPISTALGEIYQYEVFGPGYTLAELREIHDYLIVPQLKTIRGVTEITAFGGFVKQYEVHIDPKKMRLIGIGWQEIIDKIQQNNGVSGGNFIEINDEQYIIRGDGRYTDTNDIGLVFLREQGGRPLLLKDIAEIKIGKELRQGAVTKDGKGEVVTGVVMMLRDENSRKVIAAIHKRVEEVNERLPEGVEIRPFYDQSELVGRTTATLITNLTEGGFFVIVVLLLLLGELRGALIVAAAIPLSMLCAFVGMREVGLAANLMSLGAIDFGMIVDGSVVMMENIVRRLRRRQPHEKIDTIIIEAAGSVGRPVFFGILIIVLVYVPIATFSGIEGTLFRPMALTIALALLGSLLFALAVVPVVASIVFRNGVKQRRTLVSFIEKPYQNILRWILRNPLGGIFVALAIFLAGLAIGSRLGTDFLPELEEGSILVELIQLPSVTLDHAVATADRLAGEIKRALPEVAAVVPKTGRSDLANDWMGVHQTDIFIPLKNEKYWRPGVTKDSLEKVIAAIMEDEPGIAFNLTQPIAMRVDELTSGVKSDIAIKIFGENLDTLSALGQRIVGIVEKIDGTDNVYTEEVIGQPYVTILPCPRRSAAAGIGTGDVLTAIAAGIGGVPVGQVVEGQRRFDIRLRLAAQDRDNLRKIEQVPLLLPTGEMLPLAAVADFTLAEGPREIARENSQRRTIVSINIRDISLGDYVKKLREAIHNEANIPGGYFIRLGGTFENQERAQAHLFVVVPLVFVIILTLLFIMFGTLRHTLLVLLNLPFALSGGIFILWLRDLHLSVSASIGFIALFGVAVLNGIVLIEHLNELRASGLSLRVSILRGAKDRLRPVLMTALVAGLGFIPMAFNTGPGSEVQRPLATVVIGGLVTATFLTLFVLPLLYRLVERRHILNRRRGKR